jgi:PPOX class probable F420-dependent enzyme
MAPSARLDQAEIQKFLAGRYIAVLATVQPDGSPLAMPMWFLPDPSVITMLSVDNLQKVKNLRRDPRACVTVETSAASGSDGRGVIVAGRAEFLSDGPERRAIVERFHARYPELRKHWGGLPMPANRVMFRITPQRVGSWGLA